MLSYTITKKSNLEINKVVFISRLNETKLSHFSNTTIQFIQLSKCSMTKSIVD